MSYLELARSKMERPEFSLTTEQAAVSVAQDTEIIALLLASVAESLETIANRMTRGF